MLNGRVEVLGSYLALGPLIGVGVCPLNAGLHGLGFGFRTILAGGFGGGSDVPTDAWRPFGKALLVGGLLGPLKQITTLSSQPAWRAN